MLVLVGLSYEASRTLQILSYILSLSLHHKLRATHMDSVLNLVFRFLVIAPHLMGDWLADILVKAIGLERAITEAVVV